VVENTKQFKSTFAQDNKLILFIKKNIFVFNIAKNANSSIKNAISNSGNQYADVITRFNYEPLIKLDGGNRRMRPSKLHFGNLSWIELERHFPTAFKKLSGYESFVIIRDPMERFISACCQHILHVNKGSIASLSDLDVERTIYNVIEHLNAHGDNCEELTVFKRQTDYVYNENKNVKTNNLFLIENITEFYEQLLVKTGCKASHHEIINQNHIQNRFYEWTKGYRLSRLLPAPLKQRAKDLLVAHYGLKNKHRSTFSLPIVEDFVREYYSDDLACFTELKLKNDHDRDVVPGYHTIS